MTPHQQMKGLDYEQASYRITKLVLSNGDTVCSNGPYVADVISHSEQWIHIQIGKYQTWVNMAHVSLLTVERI